MILQSTKEQFHVFRMRVFKDQRSFEILLKSNDTGERIKRYLFTKFQTKQDAEDAYSITCLRTWDYATNINNQVTHFSGLMNSIAKSCVAEYYRSRKIVEMPIQTDTHEFPIESKHSGQKISEWVDGELMKKAMQQLDEDDCEIITLKYFEGYQIKEIAERFEKTENATSVMLHRALKKLREIIETSGQAG